MLKDETCFDYLDTPIGELELCADSSGLISVLFVKTKKIELQKKEVKENSFLNLVKEQLLNYFNYNSLSFNLPFSFNATYFQNKVWNELVKIPYAKHISYLDLAKKLGDEKCIRAAASANGKNPLTIIIPCHRVIGKNGNLTGYAGDLWRKQWLLDHEAKQSGTLMKLF